MAEQAKKANTKHGATVGKVSSEYIAWKNMRARCNNSNNTKYQYYGGIGIKVCERWDDFTLFLLDMGKKPSPKHSIDRYPDKEGNYEPGNCRWATTYEQASNTTKNKFLELEGVRLTYSQWSRKLGVRYYLIDYYLGQKQMPLSDFKNKFIDISNK